MKHYCYLLFVFILLTACKQGNNSKTGTKILEVRGKILYKEEIDNIIPQNSSVIDSADIADRYIQKWVTDVLMYENALNNIASSGDIEKMVEEYRKSLVIHEYEQILVEERVDSHVDEAQLMAFYEVYKPQLLLKDNVIKGVMLVLPIDAPQLNDVKDWVRKVDTKSLENIEKYSLRNAISYDYFSKWTLFSDVLKLLPLTVEDTKDYVLNTKFTEISDSTKLYFLSITDVLTAGNIEPYEIARDKIENIILNKRKSDFIIDIEKSIYEDAIKHGEVHFLK